MNLRLKQFLSNFNVGVRPPVRPRDDRRFVQFQSVMFLDQHQPLLPGAPQFLDIVIL